MYGKVMSISDEMMWRYYELLTDVRSDAIAQMKADVASGKAHPMALKKELARSIVADFHSVEAAEKAALDWARQFQKDQVPEEAEEVSVDFGEIATAERDGIQLDRLLVHCGLADSRTDAARKLKQGSVRVEDVVRNHHTYQVNPERFPLRLPIRVGKRIKVAVVR
jgi:tyrosyl-tRNA synthetase